MSRREWRCRNPRCRVLHGSILGRLTGDGNGLILAADVVIDAVYLDTGRVVVACPACGASRDFRGRFVTVR